MRIQRYWILSVLTMLAVMASAPRAWGQYGAPLGTGPVPNAPAQAQMPNYPPVGGPMAMPGPGGGPIPMGQPMGQPMIQPASYPPPGMMPMGSPMMPGAAMDGGYYGGPAAGGCPSCGGAGCGYCSDNFDLGIFRCLLPYAEGGNCSQRWFDFNVEFINLVREDVSRSVLFTSDGLGGGNIVLSSDSLNFHEEQGFRATGALQLGVGTIVEAHYVGSVNWNSVAEVTGADTLFSVFSDFGTNPPLGFGETDFADLHRIQYSSSFDSIELDFRKRWVGPNCRLQGSWMHGFRFFQLNEEFVHFTNSSLNASSMRYVSATDNNMVGWQLGGDLWASIIPGLRIGGDLEAGIYYNRADAHTNIQATSLTTPVVETVASETVAMVAEANLGMTWRVNQNWTLRAGYQFLYVDGVALAIENFNSGPPFVQGARTPFINDNGNVFYHGLTAGFEWMW